jgi:hypothetical protein
LVGELYRPFALFLHRKEWLQLPGTDWDRHRDWLTVGRSKEGYFQRVVSGKPGCLALQTL